MNDNVMQNLVLRPRVVYLHGFNSSPASLKASLVVDFCQRHHIESVVPALSHDPVLAMQTLEAAIAAEPAPALLIGSSLGGYYATWLSEKYRLKAALVNPAVAPCATLHAEFLGHQRNPYSGEEYEFTQQHVESLRQFAVQRISNRHNYLLLVQTGDEVLDYRLAVQHYAGSQQLVQTGGNHSFENFADCLPRLMQFAGLSMATTT
jgi:uncharacterized protein